MGEEPTRGERREPGSTSERRSTAGSGDSSGIRRSRPAACWSRTRSASRVRCSSSGTESENAANVAQHGAGRGLRTDTPFANDVHHVTPIASERRAPCPDGGNDILEDAFEAPFECDVAESAVLITPLQLGDFGEVGVERIQVSEHYVPFDAPRVGRTNMAGVRVHRVHESPDLLARRA